MMPYAQKPMHMGGCGPHHWGPPIRECHKKCQELLVEPATKAAAPADTSGNAVNVNSELNTHILEGMETATYVANTGQAIIGFRSWLLTLRICSRFLNVVIHALTVRS